ncbi:MAG: isoamylase early set domain-containing protein [Spirochaetia bacterium]
MDAGDLDRILGQWEETGEISPDEVESIEQALSHGDPQAIRVRKLLPLLRRDAAEAASQAPAERKVVVQESTTPESTAAPATPQSGTAQSDTLPTHTDTASSIMQALASEGDPAEPSVPSRPASTSRFPKLSKTFHRQGVRTAAVAASLVFAVAAASLVSYSLGYREGSGTSETAVTETGEQSDTVTVQFRVVMPDAEEVSLIGDFNDWDPEATPLTLRDDGRTWSATLDLRGDRAYTYNFVVDDEQVIPDPAADRTIPDSFGGEKSVISL